MTAMQDKTPHSKTDECDEHDYAGLENLLEFIEMAGDKTMLIWTEETVPDELRQYLYQRRPEAASR